jgi:murein DD-endopeptidase MepM/ murein hydrolase activator NlpD
MIYMPQFVKKFIFIFSIFLVLTISPAYGQDQAKLDELNRQIEEYSSQIARLQTQATTLANEIAQFNARIHLTELKIDQTQEQIILLGGRIDQLSISLDNLSTAFNSRVGETYKLARVEDSPILLLASENVSEAVSKFHYLQKIQQADKKLLDRLDTAKTVYTEQKTELEELEQVLAEQKAELDQQKVAKASLLALTRNDEKRYQELLAATRAEYEAIQAIIAGRGEETEFGHVNTGDRIAGIIQGPSCNSSGAHVHFIVSRNQATENPFSYLRPGVDFRNCSGPGECSEGDSFNPSGSWDWPINPTIKYSQGYGSTWAVQNTWVGKIYSFHNGIDINSDSSSEVKAVQSGILYRGSFSTSSGCRLRYARVKHDTDGIDTFYLHINY